MNGKPFFMIYVDGGESPTVKHPNLMQAKNEAKRLASLTGRKAYILASVQSYEEKKYTVEDILPNEIDASLPF